MKKKLFVILIALVLATSIIGASYALYVKTDSKHVTIGYDADAVSLTFGSTTLSAVTDLSPKAGKSSKTYDIDLNISGTPDAGMQGFFKLSITDKDSGNLSSVLVASAVVTHKDTTTSNVDHATLTGAGYNCALADLPESVELTIALNTAAPGFDFADYEEEAVDIKLYWIPYDNAAYYLRSASTDWLPDPAMKMTVNPSDPSEYMMIGVALAAGQEFKITQNGNWYNNIKSGAGNLCLYNSTSDNLYVENAGVYDLYFTVDNGLWIKAHE